METTRIKWVPSFEAFPQLLNISKGDGRQFSNQSILARKYQIFLQRVLLDRYGVVPRGVVHAGGHFGEELFEYLLLGFTKVLVVEPNPQVFDNLDNTVRTLNEVFKEVISFFQADHLVQVPAIRAVNCALSDTNGTCDLLITEDSLLTSMLLPKDDKFEGGTQRVRVSHTVSVATQTLDHLEGGCIHIQLFSVKYSGGRATGSEGGKKQSFPV